MMASTELTDIIERDDKGRLYHVKGGPVQHLWYHLCTGLDYRNCDNCKKQGLTHRDVIQFVLSEYPLHQAYFEHLKRQHTRIKT